MSSRLDGRLALSSVLCDSILRGTAQGRRRTSRYREHHLGKPQSAGFGGWREPSPPAQRGKPCIAGDLGYGRTHSLSWSVGSHAVLPGGGREGRGIGTSPARSVLLGSRTSLRFDADRGGALPGR